MIGDGTMKSQLSREAFDEAVRKKVGRNIKKLRTGYGWTIQYLSDLIGLSWHTVYKWEHARISPSVPHMLWLCKCTGWKLSEILGDGPSGTGKNGGGKT